MNIPTVNATSLRALKRIRRLRIKLSALALTVMAMALVAHAVLGVTYLQQQRERDGLASDVQAGRQSLTEYGDAASRQQQLAAAEAALEAEQAAFSSRLSGTGIVGALAHLAEESGLKVTEVMTYDRDEMEVGEHTYHALSVSARVEGTLDALRLFVNGLESGALQAVRIEELSIADVELLPAPSPDEADTPEVQHSLTVNIDLSVFARE